MELVEERVVLEALIRSVEVNKGGVKKDVGGGKKLGGSKLCFLLVVCCCMHDVVCCNLQFVHAPSINIYHFFQSLEESQP